MLSSFISDDGRAPTLTFGQPNAAQRPSSRYYTNENSTISWTINDNATVSCVLDAPQSISPIDCSTSGIQLYGLTSGVYSVFIIATDEFGNVGRTQRFTWFVG